MTGAQFRSIRHKLGLSAKAFGRAIGYAGNDNTTSVVVRRYESNGRPIPPWIARLAYMYGLKGIPEDIEEQTK